MTQSLKKELTGIFLVLGSGLLAGLVFALWLAFQYGPSGSYSVDQVLINPQYFSNFSYVEEGDLLPRRFFLKKVDYRYWDEARSTWGQRPVSEKAYKAFFDRISGQKSLDDQAESFDNIFSQGATDSLMFWVEEEGRGSGLLLFLQVDFSSKNRIFRVSLRSPSGKSAYFSYPSGWEPQF